MPESIEQGSKWWIRYVIVPLVVAVIGGGGILGIVVALPRILATPTVPPVDQVACPINAQTDFETITNILNAEGNAILEKDLNLVQQIYADNAVIRDAVSGQVWSGPVEKYQELFAEQDFQRLEHFGPQLIDQDEQTAWVTSGVRGSFTDANSGQIEEFESDTRSDHWTFGKNASGCWVITSLVFNATNETFP